MEASATTSAIAVRIPADTETLDGDVRIPAGANGIVVFAHGSGSSRHSSRNRFVAENLHRGGLATLLFALLTPEEEDQERITHHLRFNIHLLAQRLVAATDWLADQPQTRQLPVGYFGASTGGGAALTAAAIRSKRVSAVVSRGGRPDLAGAHLVKVRAPTLLIVGGLDSQVLTLNRQALVHLTGEKRLEVVEGATHLFEEPGALEQVAGLACDWFQRHLLPPATT